MKDSRTKSLLKAFSWRISATLVTVSAALIMDIETPVAAGIAAIDFGAKIFLYYIHERAWSKMDPWREK